MPDPGHAARAADPHFAANASAFRGLVALLREHGRLEAVLAWVSPSTRALVQHPPSVMAFIEGRNFVEVQTVVADRFGLPYLRKIACDSMMHSSVPLVRPAIERMLRAFGASPGTIFARSPSLITAMSRGVVFEYRALSARSGEMKVVYPTSRNIPFATFMTVSGVMDLLFQIAGHPDGQASEPVIVPDGNQNTAIVSLSW